MAKRYTVKTSLTVMPDMQKTLEAVSQRFNLPVSQIVRECIESYLPRLVELYKEIDQNRDSLAELRLHDG